MKPKVIQILAHSPPAYGLVSKPEHHVGTKRKPYWIGFWEGDWHTLVAQHVLKVTDKYNFECWRPYRWADKIYSREVNGIIHKVFPSRRVKLGRFYMGEYSPLMIKELHRETENGRVLVHLHGIRNILHHSLLLQAGLKNIPVMAQNHEDVSFHSSFLRHKWLLPLGIMGLLERKLVQNIDHLLVLTTREKEDWFQVFKGPIEIQTMGVNFEVWKPMNKAKARGKTRLPQDRRVMLSASNLVGKKGIHHILQALPGVIEKYPNILYLVVGHGIEKYEQLLKRMVSELHIENSVKFMGYVEDDTLLYLYNAADVFISASRSEGGPVSVMKAFATSTPVITTSVGNVAETMREFGIDFVVPSEDSEQLGKAIIAFFQNQSKFKGYRDITINRYDWSNIAKSTVKIYDKLFNKYYKE